eukprot:scaffold3559_cov284-Chaetoceros_neogracile.AAC.16
MLQRLQRTIRPLQRTFADTSQSASTFTTTNTSTRSSTNTPLAAPNHQILSAALSHVHTYGWTEQALAQGVLTSKLPPSYIGLITDKKSELIHFFMQDSNDRLSQALKEEDIEGKYKTHADIIEWAIKTRLEMNIPFVRSKRWAEGMALGAMPLNAYETANHLEDMVKIIESGMMRCGGNHDQQPLGVMGRGAIGAVYVATELHLLSDDSADHQDTWMFLKHRVRELELAAQNDFLAVPSSDMLVAGAAVASSLGGAVLSLVAPAAAAGVQSMAGSVVPQIMKFMQPPTVDSTVGTYSQDYDVSDLPPFETDKSTAKK